jgi:hypothetical protein
VTRRGGYLALAASVLIALVCAGLIAWRLAALRPGQQPPAAASRTGPPETTVNPQPPAKISTIIDLPGDPVLVRRGAVTAPKDLMIAVPAKLGQDAPKVKANAYFVNSTLVSTTGGYMGKFPEGGHEADAFALQLLVNSDQMGGAQTTAQIEAGSDDDGGADTSVDAQSQVLTSANSNQLEVTAADSQGLPQLKETILRTPVAERISDLLIANGYAEESARMIESAANQS